VELTGFEPQTSCMPSSGNPSTRVSLQVTVLPRPLGSTRVWACCGTSLLCDPRSLPYELSARTPATLTAGRSAESCLGQRREIPGVTSPIYSSAEVGAVRGMALR
jgi:hypothetical protein